MANEKQLKKLKQGVKAWNEWREANPEVKPSLKGADLSGTNLSEVNLFFADLDGANLSKANLIGADLSQANLSSAHLGDAELRRADLSAADLGGADLRGADLRGANLNSTDLASADLSGARLSEATLHGARLRGVKLRESDLRKSDLRGADLLGADLSAADLSEARIGYTTFAKVDLSTVKGIESIKHSGSSAISIDCIYRSKGKIPVHFLRGAGVPDNFIEYMSSLVGTAFEFYSCFISYSGKDQEFADRLHADLQDKGVRCWFAPHHVQAGKKLYEQIDTAIRLHERVLLILSPDSINSEWVKTEIAKARKREIKEGKRVLFPIRLNISFKELEEWECFDADRGKDSAREIREYYIPDFTQWKDHDQYQKEFDKLLRDLKKETATVK